MFCFVYLESYFPIHPETSKVQLFLEALPFPPVPVNPQQSWWWMASEMHPFLLPRVMFLPFEFSFEFNSWDCILHQWSSPSLVPITGTYTRSQMMQVPSVLAVTHSSLLFFTRMQDTEDLCSFSASSSFWIWWPMCHTLTWKPQSTGSQFQLGTFWWKTGPKSVLTSWAWFVFLIPCSHLGWVGWGYQVAGQEYSFMEPGRRLPGAYIHFYF